ncbi:MAG: phenylalanine--tRNA ligase beta subunit-related protein [SAR202 cluster bacterium]|jgi:DNA/RNA-binding domain of Phe-tRNA-synthetase-like protein|nr:phenylalanine--tRNA ligase beta subunit-related protein [SAR202 cluster bacterium]MDP6512618.1 phenylalanine--tRNA ligase beta subunit-related protein [SAR202 cluster bacterium]MDP6716363.1 phenylalanine--tRNA ligase beta subunit-related protein [SAR202 cluster bacterium]
MNYSVSQEIFEQFPGYVRGVVIARGVSNGDSPPELVYLLREAEDSARGVMEGFNIAEHPRIAAWRAAYRWFGARPSDFRCSIEAMSRRLVRGDSLPTINRLVDIGNVISLRHVLSAGCHALDVAQGDFELRPARGSESFVPLGSSESESPEPGEIILVEGDETVLTRRWTWRQGQHTATTSDSTAVELNVDGLPPVEFSEVSDACAEATELILRFSGGEISTQFLTGENPTITVG